jgi:protein-disulfide isomerase
VERQLIEQYVTTGKVRFEYHHFIVVDGNVGGNESRHAAEASECANEQGKFWDYHAMLFANQQGEGQGAFADRRLKAFAEALGLDTGIFNACFDSHKYAGAVQTDEQQARARGVNGTPTLFVNGQRVENPTDFNELQRWIEAGLAASN